MSRDIFNLDLYKNKMTQDAKDWVEEQFPEEYYGKISYYEGWDLRALFEQAYMAGKESVLKELDISDVFHYIE